MVNGYASPKNLVESLYPSAGQNAGQAVSLTKNHSRTPSASYWLLADRPTPASIWPRLPAGLGWNSVLTVSTRSPEPPQVYAILLRPGFLIWRVLPLPTGFSAP